MLYSLNYRTSADTACRNQNKQRELIEILTRDDGDDSGAISLSAIKDIASIGSSVASAIGSLFHSKCVTTP